MYRDNTKPQSRTLLLTLNYGGLGDNIARLPAIQYLMEKTEHQIYLFNYDYFFEFTNSWLSDKHWKHRVFHIPMSKKAQFLKDRPEKAILPNVDFTPHSNTSMHCHLIDHGYLVINDMIPYNPWERNYPKISSTVLEACSVAATPLKPYVVLTTGATCKSREWPAGEINDIIDFLVRNGIQPVFLGSRDMPLGNDHKPIEASFPEGVDYGRGLDLRGRTSLLEALKVMSEAKAVVGVDNGLLHLAAMSDVQIVMGFTNTLPIHRAPIRQNQLGYKVELVLPDEELKCGGCQSRWILPFGANFTKCGYKDYKCVEQMRASKFIGALKRALNLNGTEHQAKLTGPATKGSRRGKS